MLSKHHGHNYSADAVKIASKFRTFKSRNISRLYPLLSSLKYFKPKSHWTHEFCGGRGEKDYVVLLFLSYMGWKRVAGPGQLEDMELHSVRNDPHMLLDYLNYRHDDTSRDWYFLMDFDLEYKDWTGVTKTLARHMPTKNTILRTLREATRKGGSGFIHVGAHCMYDYPGTSHLYVQGRSTVYSEISNRQTHAKPATYLISSDGQRVSGKEFHTCLSDDPGMGRHGTLTLSLDICNAGVYLKDLLSLSCLNHTTSDPTTTVEQTRSRKQLILISSSQAGQSASSRINPAGYEGEFGAGTSLLIEFLSENPSASPTEVIRYLNAVCGKRKDEHMCQSPCIASRYPIYGALRLLPTPTPMP